MLGGSYQYYDRNNSNNNSSSRNGSVIDRQSCLTGPSHPTSGRLPVMKPALVTDYPLMTSPLTCRQESPAMIAPPAPVAHMAAAAGGRGDEAARQAAAVPGAAVQSPGRGAGAGGVLGGLSHRQPLAVPVLPSAATYYQQYRHHRQQQQHHRQQQMDSSDVSSGGGWSFGSVSLHRQQLAGGGASSSVPRVSASCSTASWWPSTATTSAAAAAVVTAGAAVVSGGAVVRAADITVSTAARAVLLSPAVAVTTSDSSPSAGPKLAAQPGQYSYSSQQQQQQTWQQQRHKRQRRQMIDESLRGGAGVGSALPTSACSPAAAGGRAVVTRTDGNSSGTDQRWLLHSTVAGGRGDSGDTCWTVSHGPSPSTCARPPATVTAAAVSGASTTDRPGGVVQSAQQQHLLLMSARANCAVRRPLSSYSGKASSAFPRQSGQPPAAPVLDNSGRATVNRDCSAPTAASSSLTSQSVPGGSDAADSHMIKSRRAHCRHQNSSSTVTAPVPRQPVTAALLTMCSSGSGASVVPVSTVNSESAGQHELLRRQSSELLDLSASASACYSSCSAGGHLAHGPVGCAAAPAVLDLSVQSVRRQRSRMTSSVSTLAAQIASERPSSVTPRLVPPSRPPSLQPRCESLPPFTAWDLDNRVGCNFSPFANTVFAAAAASEHAFDLSLRPLAVTAAAADVDRVATGAAAAISGGRSAAADRSSESHDCSAVAARRVRSRASRVSCPGKRKRAADHSEDIADDSRVKVARTSDGACYASAPPSRPAGVASAAADAQLDNEDSLQELLHQELQRIELSVGTPHDLARLFPNMSAAIAATSSVTPSVGSPLVAGCAAAAAATSSVTPSVGSPLVAGCAAAAAGTSSVTPSVGSPLVAGCAAAAAGTGAPVGVESKDTVVMTPAQRRLLLDQMAIYESQISRVCWPSAIANSETSHQPHQPAVSVCQDNARYTCTVPLSSSSPSSTAIATPLSALPSRAAASVETTAVSPHRPAPSVTPNATEAVCSPVVTSDSCPVLFNSLSTPRSHCASAAAAVCVAPAVSSSTTDRPLSSSYAPPASPAAWSTPIQLSSSTSSCVASADRRPGTSGVDSSRPSSHIVALHSVDVDDEWLSVCQSLAASVRHSSQVAHRMMALNTASQQERQSVEVTCSATVVPLPPRSEESVTVADKSNCDHHSSTLPVSFPDQLSAAAHSTDKSDSRDGSMAHAVASVSEPSLDTCSKSATGAPRDQGTQHCQVSSPATRGRSPRNRRSSLALLLQQHGDTAQSHDVHSARQLRHCRDKKRPPRNSDHSKHHTSTAIASPPRITSPSLFTRPTCSTPLSSVKIEENIGRSSTNTEFTLGRHSKERVQHVTLDCKPQAINGSSISSEGRVYDSQYLAMLDSCSSVKTESTPVPSPSVSPRAPPSSANTSSSSALSAASSLPSILTPVCCEKHAPTNNHILQHYAADYGQLLARVVGVTRRQMIVSRWCRGNSVHVTPRAATPPGTRHAPPAIGDVLDWKMSRCRMPTALLTRLVSASPTVPSGAASLHSCSSPRKHRDVAGKMAGESRSGGSRRPSSNSTDDGGVVADGGGAGTNCAGRLGPWDGGDPASLCGSCLVCLRTSARSPVDSICDKILSVGDGGVGNITAPAVPAERRPRQLASPSDALAAGQSRFLLSSVWPSEANSDKQQQQHRQHAHCRLAYIEQLVVDSVWRSLETRGSSSATTAVPSLHTWSPQSQQCHRKPLARALVSRYSLLRTFPPRFFASHHHHSLQQQQQQQTKDAASSCDVSSSQANSSNHNCNSGSIKSSDGADSSSCCELLSTPDHQLQLLPFRDGSRHHRTRPAVGACPAVGSCPAVVAEGGEQQQLQQTGQVCEAAPRPLSDLWLLSSVFGSGDCPQLLPPRPAAQRSGAGDERCSGGGAVHVAGWVAEHTGSPQDTLPGRRRSSAVRVKRRRCRFKSGLDYLIKRRRRCKPSTGAVRGDGAACSVSSATSPDAAAASRAKRCQTERRVRHGPAADLSTEIRGWVLNRSAGETALLRAAKLGHPEAVLFLLEQTACAGAAEVLVNQADHAGFTPLHEASARGHVTVARLLLMFGANVSVSARGGVRPLHEAVEQGCVQMVRLLLSYGADPTVPIYSGLTPLQLAEEAESESVADLLRAHLNDIDADCHLRQPWVLPAARFMEEPGCHLRVLDTSCLAAPPVVSSPPVTFDLSSRLLPSLYCVRAADGSSCTDHRYVALESLARCVGVASGAELVAARPELGALLCRPASPRRMVPLSVGARPEPALAPAVAPVDSPHEQAADAAGCWVRVTREVHALMVDEHFQLDGSELV